MAALPAAAPAAAKQERKQNKAIKKNAKDLKSAVSTLGSLATKLNALSTTLTTLGAQAGALPPILTALGNGLTAAGNGLTALKGALTTLSHVTTSQTHIVAQLFTGSPVAANAVKGCFVSTPPLPFDGNQVLGTMTCTAVQIQTNPGAGENAPDTGGTLNVVASCRSNKTNVTGASAPCGLGGIVSLTVNKSPAGGFAGTFAAPTGVLVTLPNAGLGGGPLVAFPTANPIPDLTGAGGTNNTAAPLSLTSNDAAVILLSDTSGSGTAKDLGAAPALPTCTGGATPCISTINITIRGVDSNPQLS
jgi:hypothetical protein